MAAVELILATAISLACAAPATRPAATAPAPIIRPMPATAPAPAVRLAPATAPTPIIRPPTAPAPVIRPATAPATTSPAPASRPRPRPAPTPASRHAARADAIRKLAGRIGAIQITPEVAVGDLVADSNTVAPALEALLTGLPETHPPAAADDGACEVVLSVRLADLAAGIEQIHARYYDGRRFREIDFARMAPGGDARAFTETGTSGRAAPPPGAEPIRLKPGRRTLAASQMPPGARKLWAAHGTYRGRRLAERAAYRDALRRLAERIAGVHVGPDETLGELVADSDDPNASLTTFLRGAVATGLRYRPDAPIVEMDVEIPLRVIFAAVKSWGRAHLRADAARIRRLEELTVKAERRVLGETGTGVPPPDEMTRATPPMRRLAALARAAPPWTTRSLKAVGTASARRPGRLPAPAAAELDARVKLAEKIRALPVAAGKTVADLAAQDAGLAAAVLAFQQGARITEAPPPGPQDEAARARVEVPLAGLWRLILHHAATSPAPD